MKNKLIIVFLLLFQTTFSWSQEHFPFELEDEIHYMLDRAEERLQEKLSDMEEAIAHTETPDLESHPTEWVAPLTKSLAEIYSAYDGDNLSNIRELSPDEAAIQTFEYSETLELEEEEGGDLQVVALRSGQMGTRAYNIREDYYWSDRSISDRELYLEGNVGIYHRVKPVESIQLHMTVDRIDIGDFVSFDTMFVKEVLGIESFSGKISEWRAIIPQLVAYQEEEATLTPDVNQDNREANPLGAPAEEETGTAVENE